MIAWFDIFSGISGDMTLGAFVDLGVPVDWLRKQLTLLPIEKFVLRHENVLRNGIKAVNFFVEINDYSHSGGHAHDGAYSHVNTHETNGETHAHTSVTGDLKENGNTKNIHYDIKPHVEPHVHQNNHIRNYREIRKIIAESKLPARVKALSLSAFEKIAVAESEIHGLDIENVHFHEVGAIDSIVDIVGSFLCVDFLGITEVYASAIPLGKGFVKCIHGTLPVPAPAVVSILKGIPVKESNIEMELVTPTGAAIIATLAVDFGPMPDMIIDGAGYGSGKNQNSSGIPNFLRVVTGKRSCNCNLHRKSNLPGKNDGYVDDEYIPDESQIIEEDNIFVVETSIDDMIPEISGYLMEKLFEKGALDVCHIPVQMKKNRPGTRLEVICREGDSLKKIINLILNETTTMGVRCHREKRFCLKRKKIFIDTRFGKIKAKEITGTTGKKRIAPEYEECRNIAVRLKLPLRDVYTQVCLDINHGKIL